MNPTELDWTPLKQEPGLTNLAGMTVLVTGGAGFIGSHLVDALVSLGARVRILDNLATSRLENLCRHFGTSKIAVLRELLKAPERPVLSNGDGCPVTLIVGDIRNQHHCQLAFGLGSAPKLEPPEVVIHLAALGSVPRSMAHPAETTDVNVAGTARVFEAAREAHVRRVVYASSSSVYGDSSSLPKREGEEGKPLSPYALSKKMNELLAETFGRCFDLEFVGLRFFNVYGPRQNPDGPYAAVVPRFITAALRGEPMVIYGDGMQSRDFTFVGDAVRATLLAAVSRGTATGVFNVAAGACTSVRDLARMILDWHGGGPEPRHEPPRPGDVRVSQADVTRAREHLGFVARIPVREGLRLTYLWFLNHHDREAASNGSG